MGELEKGLWHGEAPPGLEAWEEWGQMVSPHTIDDGQRLLLFDLAVPSEIENLAREGAGDGDRPDVPVA